MYVILFFFNDTATTEIYTLSLHDALPICVDRHRSQPPNSTAWARFCSTRRTVLLPPSSSSSIQTSSTRADSCTSETRSEEHTSELQSRQYLVCRLLLDTNIIDQQISQHYV